MTRRVQWTLRLSALALCAAVAMLAARSSPQQRELTIATVNNADMILMQQLSSEFEKQSGIRLRWVVLGENILRQRLTIDISTGSNTFDVITIGSYETPLWAEQKWLLPLDDFDPSYDYDDIFPVVREGLSFQHRLYALPFYSESSFTYYRQDLFARAGLSMPTQPTYQQIRRFAQVLHDPQHSVYGICLRGESGWGENVALLSTMVQTFGGRWTDMQWRPQLNTGPWKEAVGTYIDLLRDFGPPGAANDGYNENRALFANGNCAMWIDSTSAAGYFLDPSQSRVSATTAFAKAPVAAVPTGAAWIWTWGLAVPSTSTHVAEAKEFIRWATSREYVTKVADRFGWLRVPPGARQSTYQNPAYLALAPFAPLVREAMASSDIQHPSSLPVPYVGIQYMGIPEFQAMGTEIGQELNAVLAGHTSVDQALTEAQEEAEHALRGRMKP